MQEAERLSREAELTTAAATERAAAAATAQTNSHSVLPALRETEAERAAAFQRLRNEREMLDAEERRARETSARLERQLNEIRADIARESDRGADATRTMERLDAEIAEISGGAEPARGHSGRSRRGRARNPDGAASRESELDEARAEAAALYGAAPVAGARS